jgi:hypothetical protein
MFQRRERKTNTFSSFRYTDVGSIPIARSITLVDSVALALLTKEKGTNWGAFWPQVGPKFYPMVSGQDVRDLYATTQEFAALLRLEFASEIDQDARGFKRRVLGFLKSELPPRPGRPRTEAVTHATEMLAQGKTWQKIYAACLSPIAAPDSRQVQQSRLRCAVRSRRNARRRRKSVLNSATKKI